jgi:hypothetical protein
MANPIASFVEALLPQAKAAEAETGIPAHILLGQAGLETGWGRSLPKNADGTSSNNYFGIKAGGNWQGKSARTATNEEVGGRMVRIQDNFRAYDNPSQSMADWAKLLGDNRYANARAAAMKGDPSEFGAQIYKAGYATDSRYPQKVSAAISAVQREMGAGQPVDLFKANGIAPQQEPVDLFAAMGIKPTSNRAQPTADQKTMASLPMRFAKGVTDSLDAGAQYLPWALGAASGAFGLAPNKVSDWFFDQSRQVSEGINERENTYQEARKAVSGDVGFDSARMSGNVLSPVTALMGATGSLPTSLLGRAAVGAGMGGMGAISTPVVDVPLDRFGEQKAKQAIAGAVAGAVLTPAAAKAADVVGSVADKAINAARNAMGRGERVNEQIVLNSIRTELEKQNLSLDTVPRHILEKVNQQVQAALRSGRTADPAALLRQADFEAVGTRGTLGQITRDPVQYTKEMNLRGVAGPGDPLMRRFNEQRVAFGDVLNNLGARGADDAYTAGQRLTDSLAAFDAPKKAGVDALYNSAKDTSGRYAQMNTQQFSTLANDAIDYQMLNRALPKEARLLFNDVVTGKIPLNVNTSVMLRESLGETARDLTKQGQDKPAKAVRQIISALDATDVAPGAGEQAVNAFSTARKAAAQRFGVIEKNPALKAFLDGDANLDTFVSKYVLNGNTDDLKQLTQILNPQGKNVVRQQIAAELERKAFGSNVTADSAFAVERYNETLKKMGREKLAQFFSAEEIDQLSALGRAAAWAGKRPAGSAVNESNTAAATMNLLASLKGASFALPVVRQVRDSMVVSRGLRAQPPSNPIPVLSPALRALVPGVPVAAGAGVGGLLSYQ